MIMYLLKVTIISTAFYLIYKLVLHSSASLKFNRFYLLGSILLSILLPVVSFTVPSPEEENLFFSKGNNVLSEVSFVEAKIQENLLLQENNIEFLSIISVTYILVVILLLIRLILNSKTLFTIEPEDQLLLNGMQVYFQKENAIFSFFNRLYMPEKYKNELIEETVLRHEAAHYNQLHSIDNVISELYSILFWYNPISWLIKKSIRTNHEYLADFEVVKETDQSSYMQTIINHAIQVNHPALASSFSYLSIKNRFNMIQKKRTIFKQISTASIGVLLSFSLITLFAFKAEKVAQTIDEQINIQTGFDLYKKPDGIPVPFDAIKEVTSEFGMRKHPIKNIEVMHKGDDIIADEGTPILATDNGTILKVIKSDKGYGNHIVVQHNIKYKTLDAHLSSIDVKVGDLVKKRQPIGIIGNSGTSIKTHLHYEIHEFDKPIDPNVKEGC